MADVIESRKLESAELADQLVQLISQINRLHRDCILSPFVSTLGDEFQGLVHCPKSAVHLVFEIESILRKENVPFGLRYVVYEGEIDTPVNRDMAYGMLGPALTAARELLVKKSRNRKKFQFRLEDPITSERLHHACGPLETLLGEWKADDLPFVQSLIEEPSDGKLASRWKRDRSSIYRRRKTLRTADFLALRSLIYHLATRIETGPALRATRSAIGLSQKETAERAEIPQSQLSKIERDISASVEFAIQRRLDLAFGFELPASDW